MKARHILTIALLCKTIGLKNAGSNLSEDNICSTPACVEIAEDILQPMNIAGIPCENFYSYACGNWANKNKITGLKVLNMLNDLNDNLIERFQDILSFNCNNSDNKHALNARRFYRNCADTDKLNSMGLQVIMNTIETNGGWPLLQPESWSKKNFNLAQLIANTRGLFGQGKFQTHNSEGLLFAISPVVAVESSKYWLIQPPKFFVPLQYLHRGNDHPEIFKAYENYVWNVVFRMHGSWKLQPLNEEITRWHIKDMIEFEVKLAEFVQDENFGGSKSNQMIPVKKFYLHFPREVFRKLVEIVTKTNEVDPDDQILLLQVKFFKNLKSLIRSTPVETLANYAQWRIVSELLQETTDEMREIQNLFFRETLQSSLNSKRSETCAQIGGSALDEHKYSHLGFALANTYRQRYVSIEDIAAANYTIQAVRTAFSDFVINASVEGTIERAVYLQILETVTEKTGFPDWVFQVSVLDEFYKDLQLKNNSHLEDHIIFLNWQFDKNMEMFWTDSEAHRWLDNPLSAIARYDPLRRFNVLTAGFLTPPIYVANAPLYLNLPKLGALMGKELTKGIINISVKDFLSVVKTMTDIWTHINQQMNCVEITNRLMESSSTLNEYTTQESVSDFADIAGLDLAYKAFQTYGNFTPLPMLGTEHLTKDQLFFLLYAQNWCEDSTSSVSVNSQRRNTKSGKTRVNSVLRNSKEFAQAWQCPDNSFMNPKLKCSPWKTM